MPRIFPVEAGELCESGEGSMVIHFAKGEGELKTNGGVGIGGGVEKSLADALGSEAGFGELDGVFTNAWRLVGQRLEHVSFAEFIQAGESPKRMQAGLGSSAFLNKILQRRNGG